MRISDWSSEVCSSDLTLAAARSAQISCPDTLSVVGFDDIQMARYVDPPLTTVRQPMADIGRKTVELLLDILHGRQAGPVSATLPHRLIIRQSVCLGPFGRDRKSTRLNSSH